MPPTAKKTGSVSLCSFVPSEDELVAARSILASADAKQRKSKINAMNVFLTANKEAPGNADVIKAVGKEREAYIEKYMAYQQAKKTGRLVHTRQNTNEKSRFSDVHQWNAWKCKQEVGPETFQTWIDSGKLPYIPDTLTKSDAEHMRIYQAPMAWTRQAIGQKDTASLENDGAATSADIDNFDSVRAEDAESSGNTADGKGGGGKIIVKGEVKTNAELQQDAAKVFIEQKTENMTMLATTITHLKIMAAAASGNKFSQSLSDAANVVQKILQVPEGIRRVGYGSGGVEGERAGTSHDDDDHARCRKERLGSLGCEDGHPHRGTSVEESSH